MEWNDSFHSIPILLSFRYIQPNYLYKSDQLISFNIVFVLPIEDLTFFFSVKIKYCFVT